MESKQEKRRMEHASVFCLTSELATSRVYRRISDLQSAGQFDRVVSPYSFPPMWRVVGKGEWAENWQMQVPINGRARW